MTTPSSSPADVLRIVADAAMQAASWHPKTVEAWAYSFAEKITEKMHESIRLSAQSAAPVTVLATTFMACESCGSAEVISADTRKCPGCGAPIPETPGPARPVSEPESGRTGDEAGGMKPSASGLMSEASASVSGAPKDGASPVPLPGAAQGKAMRMLKDTQDVLDEFERSRSAAPPAQAVTTAGEAEKIKMLERVARAAQGVISAHTMVTPGMEPREAERQAFIALNNALGPWQATQCASATPHTEGA